MFYFKSVTLCGYNFSDDVMCRTCSLYLPAFSTQFPWNRIYIVIQKPSKEGNHRIVMLENAFMALLLVFIVSSSRRLLSRCGVCFNWYAKVEHSSI